ncbi:MAG: biopolymer transporter ExbD [Kiritimatiellae bacterium]|nr:biopolymer transporter ExbD [Kiritimatiellia bacterium]
MKLRVRTKSRAPQLSLTSMLDVIFLLLCFFVTVSVFSQWENEISIKLPTAATSEEPDRLPGEIVVNVFKDGKVVVNGKQLPLDELQRRLARISKFYPGQPVIIRADKEVRYDTLVGVIDTCRGADVWNFSLATSGAASEPAVKK